MRATLTFALFAPLLLAATPAAAEQRSFPVSDFTGVGLGGADHVRVSVGGNFSVRAEGLPADLAELRVEKRGDALDLGRLRDRRQRRDARPVTFFVTMPRIVAANVGGSGDMVVDRAEAPTFTANVGGSGSVAIRRLAAQRVDVHIGGSGSVSAAGRAERLSVAVGGSGALNAPGLAARTADVSLAGSGQVRANVDGDAKVTVTGSGDIDLGPRSRCSVTKMGSGSVRCGTTGRG